MIRRILMLAGLCAALATANGAAQDHPAEKYGFGFENFSSPMFDWDIYRNSFYGIPIDSSTSWLTAPWDRLFYNEAFRTKLPDPAGNGSGAGNCYGISTLSLMMNKYGGYHGFCVPTIQYVATDAGGTPTNARLVRAINILHGHQLSLASIQLYLDQAVGGHSQMATYGVSLAREMIGREGPVVVSITKGKNPVDGGGHAIIGYDVVDSAPGIVKIMVVDPNRIWRDTTAGHRGWYESGQNFVLCDGNDWSFRMAGKLSDWPTDGPDDAAGSPLGHGHLTIIPPSVAGPPSRTPTSLGLGVTNLLTKIFIYNSEGYDAVVRQVRNSAGKRLFTTPGSFDVDWDTATGLCSMVPWFPTGAPPSGDKYPFLLLLNRGPFPSGSIDFTTGDGNAGMVIGGNDAYIKVTCDEPGVNATLRFAGLGSREPTVILENASKRARFDIEVLNAVEPGKTNRIYTVTGGVIPADTREALIMSVGKFGGMKLSGAASDPVEIGYRLASLLPAKNFDAQPVVMVPSEGGTIERTDWKARVAGVGMPVSGK